MNFIKKLFGKSEEQIPTIDNEPRIEVVNIHIPNPDKPTNGYFELDWNSAFVQKLRDCGYSGRSEEEVVEQWFNDLCRGVITDEDLQ